MCEDDKAKFLSEIDAVKNTIKSMEKPIVWTQAAEFPADLDAALDKYEADIKVMDMGDMTASDTSTCKSWLSELDEEV